MPTYEYQVSVEKVEYFHKNGFVTLEHVVGAEELARYRGILKDMIAEKTPCKDKRGDLGGHTERKDPTVENTIQICHPYVLTSALDECEHFRKGGQICNQLFDDEKVDFGLDCSQFLVKYANTNTETPWHQDQSYYPSSIPDKRAANVWLALEDVTVEMGCMCYKRCPLATGKLAPHRPAGNGKGALTCDPPDSETVKTPLKAGSVVVFAQHTFHFGGPNNSDVWRPAFVAQYRPKTMIQACRMIGFDHGKFDCNDGENRTSKRLKLSESEAAKAE
jgi:ectoine hydroxylase-related dioxygenase (phytanoyl-CoA dioxygenase family)